MRSSNIGLNDKNNNKLNCLAIALKRKNFYNAIRLITAGAYITAKQCDKYGLLHRAIKYGNIECTNILLMLKPSIDMPFRDLKSYSPLLLALVHKKDDFVKLLIENGADPNFAPIRYRIPLVIAMLTRNFNMVYYLYKNGANINKADYYKIPPLTYAIIYRKFAIIEFLLNRKADITLIDSMHATAMDHVMAEFSQIRKRSENLHLRSMLSCCYLMQFQPDNCINSFIKNYLIRDKLYNNIAKNYYNSPTNFHASAYLLQLITDSIEQNFNYSKNIKHCCANFTIYFTCLKEKKLKMPKMLRKYVANITFDSIFDNSLQNKIYEYCSL